MSGLRQAIPDKLVELRGSRLNGVIMIAFQYRYSALKQSTPDIDFQSFKYATIFYHG